MLHSDTLSDPLHLLASGDLDLRPCAWPCRPEAPRKYLASHNLHRLSFRNSFLPSAIPQPSQAVLPALLLPLCHPTTFTNRPSGTPSSSLPSHNLHRPSFRHSFFLSAIPQPSQTVLPALLPPLCHPTTFTDRPSGTPFSPRPSHNLHRPSFWHSFLPSTIPQPSKTVLPALLFPLCHPTTFTDRPSGTPSSPLPSHTLHRPSYRNSFLLSTIPQLSHTVLPALLPPLYHPKAFTDRPSGTPSSPLPSHNRHRPSFRRSFLPSDIPQPSQTVLPLLLFPLYHPTTFTDRPSGTPSSPVPSHNLHRPTFRHSFFPSAIPQPSQTVLPALLPPLCHPKAFTDRPSGTPSSPVPSHNLHRPTFRHSLLPSAIPQPLQTVLPLLLAPLYHPTAFTDRPSGTPSSPLPSHNLHRPSFRHSFLPSAIRIWNAILPSAFPSDSADSSKRCAGTPVMNFIFAPFPSLPYPYSPFVDFLPILLSCTG